MGYLKKAKCYLSGPIEFDSGPNWRISVKMNLKQRFKIEIVDPNADPKQGDVVKMVAARDKGDKKAIQKIMKTFVRKDLCCVDRADFLIVNLPHGVATAGTHCELNQSNDRKKPTLLVCEKGACWNPFWYFGYIPLEYIFGSWEELYQYLEKVDAGECMDDDRWAWVYKLL